MKVILLADVRGTGRKFEVKNVSDGYAMNFLLPNRLAEQATADRVKRVEQLKQEASAEQEIQTALLDKNLAALRDVVVEIKEKANEKNHLFKGVTESGILKALKSQARIELPEEAIVLEKPIKETGEFVIPVMVNGKRGSFKLVVTAR